VLERSFVFLDQLFLIVLFLLLGVSWGIGCYVASLFPGGEDRAHRYLIRWARISIGLARLQVTVAGVERLDLSRTYVFMPNHASFLDILLVLAFIPHNFRFLVKEEFFSIPFLGLTVRSSGQIPLDRKNPRKGLQSIRQGAVLLKKGVSIVVFPEGTRSRDGNIGEFKTTLFVLPIRTKTPVVPVLIEGSFEALPRGRVFLKRCPVKVTFLDPLPPDLLSDKDRALYAEQVRHRLIRSCHKQENGSEHGMKRGVSDLISNPREGL
jgi:1-acyl-sn-glycerol-3-phosphate acyltransferase